MTELTLTFSQIKAQIARIKRKVPQAHTLGIHTNGRWMSDNEIREDNSLYLIDQCDSPLAIRVALRRDYPSAATRVILTSLEDGELSDDIRVRLAKRKLFRIEGWEAVRDCFKAREFDSRVMRYPWMIDQLFAYPNLDDCPAAPGGYLDLETLWGYLLNKSLRIGSKRPDLRYLLNWSLNPENTELFRSLRPAFRAAAIDWLTEATEPASRLVLQCIERSSSTSALAIGLAALVVFHPEVEGRLDKAVGRIEERYLGGESAVKELMQRWGLAASDVVSQGLSDTKQRMQLLRSGDGILNDIQAGVYAYLSDLSPTGFDQRLERLAVELKKAITKGATEELANRHKDVIVHFQAKHESRRRERVEMAMRLVRWLNSYDERRHIPHSFADAVMHYLKEGAFVDTARLALRHGDAVAGLSEAYMEITKRSASIQEQDSRVFANLLKDWMKTGSSSASVIPVEEVLGSIAGPLSESTPILLIVMDGMSVAIFNQIIERIIARDWALVMPANQSSISAAIATVPSVTEFSRTSLLAGKLLTGNSSIEQAEFTKHPYLSRTSRQGRPPVLFHKSTLHDSDDGGLSQEIRADIASKDQQVVAVVINAIDDHLLKGDQLDIHWSPEDIKSLTSLLYEARLANRAVVILSDHGHILELSTEYVLGDGGDRWRTATRPATDLELRLEGRRVLTDGQNAVVPWSETLRYAIKKNGYHGGINPQEMVAPIAVLLPAGTSIDGWAETAWSHPEWWSEMLPARDVAAIEIVSQAPRNEFPDSLLDWKENDGVETTKAETNTTPAWVRELLASPIYAEQKRLVGRAYPKNEHVVVNALRALHWGGYKMTSGAISNCIDYPPIRLRGLLAVMQAVLNLDGYQVLNRDEESDTIELNLDLLRKQFQLG